jgi:Glycosyl transferase family 11
MIVNIQGGMGNQLFQYAFGRSLSIARNEEVFFDVSRCGGSVNGDRPYVLDQFNTKIQTADGRSGPQRGEPVFRYDPTVYEAPAGTFFNGYWQTEKYFNVPIVREELTFKTLPSNNAMEWMKKIVAGPSAFVHVRRGDYTREPHKSFHGLLSMDYYNPGIECISHQRGCSCNNYAQVKYFIFSDDPTWCRQNFSTQHEVVTGTTPLEDLWLMSACRDAIIANSSFSWWGAWLGDNRHENRIVFAPAKWFQSPSMCYDDVVPERWTKI